MLIGDRVFSVWTRTALVAPLLAGFILPMALLSQ